MSLVNVDQLKGVSSGGGSGGPSAVVSFNFASISPFIFQSVTIGQIIYRITISMTTAFNDSLAYIQLGTTTTPSLIFNSTDIDLSVITEYDSEIITTIPNNDLFIMTISPGISSQGVGTIYYWIK